MAVQVSTPSLGVILATYKDWLVHMYNFQKLGGKKGGMIKLACLSAANCDHRFPRLLLTWLVHWESTECPEHLL